MRLAAVDVGSNTIHALVVDVVDGRLEEVSHFVEMPSLGSAVARTGRRYETVISWLVAANVGPVGSPWLVGAPSWR